MRKIRSISARAVLKTAAKMTYQTRTGSQESGLRPPPQVVSAQSLPNLLLPEATVSRQSSQQVCNYLLIHVCSLSHSPLDLIL